MGRVAAIRFRNWYAHGCEHVILPRLFTVFADEVEWPTLQKSKMLIRLQKSQQRVFVFLRNIIVGLNANAERRGGEASLARRSKLQGSLQERIGEAIDQTDAQSLLSVNGPGGGKEF